MQGGLTSSISVSEEEECVLGDLEVLVAAVTLHDLPVVALRVVCKCRLNISREF